MRTPSPSTQTRLPACRCRHLAVLSTPSPPPPLEPRPRPIGPHKECLWQQKRNAAGGVDSCCFPRLGFPPSEPPFPRRPLKKEINRGENPSRLRRCFAGGTQHGSRFFIVSPPCTENAPSICRIRQPLNTFSAGVADTTLPLYQSPQPPMEIGHPGRTTCSHLNARLPALGGNVGLRPACCTAHGCRLSKECLRRHAMVETRRNRPNLPSPF